MILSDERWDEGAASHGLVSGKSLQGYPLPNIAVLVWVQVVDVAGELHAALGRKLDVRRESLVPRCFFFCPNDGVNIELDYTILPKVRRLDV